MLVDASLLDGVSEKDVARDITVDETDREVVGIRSSVP
jgi:hypothetical protein